MNYKTTALEPFGALVEPTRGSESIRSIDLGVLKSLFVEHQLLVLRGFETFQSKDDFAAYCETWGEISVWPFGKVLELVEHENPEDHIFDCSYVPMHWDGMYRPQIPEYQIFHCVTAPLSGTGGRTTFAHTGWALKNATSDERDLWSRVTVTYKRKMEFYDSRTASPIVTKHPYRGYEVIRYNEIHFETDGRLVNPVEQELRGIDRELIETLHLSLKKALYGAESFYAHEWQKNDVVIADNFTLLHGREGFKSKSPRHIRRVQVLSDPPLNNPGLESFK